MILLSQALFAIFACIVPFYLYAFLRFYSIVKLEKPEWVAVRGSLSSLYDAFSRHGDPNVTLAVIGIAFGERASQLQSPKAATYARRIRVLLPTSLILFAVGLLGVLTSAP
jgi:hypothetical protein